MTEFELKSGLLGLALGFLVIGWAIRKFLLYGKRSLVENLRSGNIDGYTEVELAQMEIYAAEWDARHGVAPEPAPGPEPEIEPAPEPQLSREALQERMDALDERLTGLTRSPD